MKQYKIFDKDVHEYTITVDKSEKGSTYFMKRSGNSAWTEPGKEILKVHEDDRAGQYVFSRGLGKKFEYSDLVELQILLNIITLDQPNLSPEYQAIPVTETIDI
jgi:hypothetical protein